MPVIDLRNYEKTEVVHTTLVSEISVLRNTVTQQDLCLKAVITHPPKPHSPVREIEILKLFRDSYPHDNIIQYVDDWKDADNWNIVFPYYRQNLRQLMIQYWEWYTPDEDASIKRKYLSGLFTLGVSREESYAHDFCKVTLEKKHFLINKTPQTLMAKVWRDLTSALKHLHKHEIMHRDLKPENVMYDEQKDRFVLIDFGVSTGTDQNQNDFLKPDGIVDVATYIYKPVELLIGIKDYNCGVDMWSLMVIMHQMSMPFICGYALKPHYYMGHEGSVDDWIQHMCDKYNEGGENVHKKYDRSKKLQTIPSLLDDGSYLVESRLELCEGSDIGLLSSIHDIFGCPLRSQFPMGESSMAWVYMYNNNDRPVEVYYRDDERRCKFIRDFMFGMVSEECKDELLNLCEFDFDKRVL